MISYLPEKNSSFPHRILIHLNGSTDPSAETESLSAESIILCIFAALIICSTLCGNVLVIIAVCTESRLRKVGNSFIVSLSVSDLLVGLLVTPIAIAYQVIGFWPYGRFLCDLWVSLDVICCTASILNLCAISFDRYNAIAQPLLYALKRTPKRAAFMISLVWTYSVMMAIPPLFGWREDLPENTTECIISQDKGYTVYSTFGSFYIPLVVMLLLYGLVFRATLHRKKQWTSGPGSSQMCKSKTLKKYVSLSVFPNNKRDGKSKDLAKPIIKKFCRKQTPPVINPRIGERLMKDGYPEKYGSFDSLPRRELLNQNHAIGGSPIPSMSSGSPCKSNKQAALVSRVSTSSNTRTPTTNGQRCSIVVIGVMEDIPQNTSTAAAQEVSTVAENHISIANRGSLINDRTTTKSLMVRLDPRKGTESDISSHSETFSTGSRIPASFKFRKKKGRFSMSQEKRAAQTLGVIMGCFILCWLPFFIVALFAPLLDFHVPRTINVTVTWLGYFNSALNPVIYTFFNADFRKAFRKICCIVFNKRKTFR